MNQKDIVLNALDDLLSITTAEHFGLEKSQVEEIELMLNRKILAEELIKLKALAMTQKMMGRKLTKKEIKSCWDQGAK